jgi:hypothetical protein
MRHFGPIDLIQMSHTTALAIPTPFTRASKSTFPDESRTQSRREPDFFETEARVTTAVSLGLVMKFDRRTAEGSPQIWEHPGR